MSWVATILTLADHLAAHPTASHAAMDAEQHQQPLPKGATHKMDLAKYGGCTICCTCLQHPSALSPCSTANRLFPFLYQRRDMQFAGM